MATAKKAPTHVKQLVPDPANRRRHTPRNIGMIVDALHHVGAGRSIVIDERNEVLAGNGVLEAAGEAGITKVKTVDADGHTLIAVRRRGLTTAQKRELALYDNRAAELAEWDTEQLRADLDAGEDLSAFFFDDELQALLADEPKTGKTDPDAVPEPRATDITTGDLFELGDHRLLCGDSTKAANAARVMDGDNAAAVVTDPPYGIGFKYASHDDARDKWFSLMDDAVPIMRSVAPFVVMPSCGIDRIGWWYERHAPDWMIAWYKGSPGHLSKIGFNDWEAHLVWGKPPKQMHDYFQTECGFDKAVGHPCPKPTAWGQWLVERATVVSGVVFDPFCGSGTTIIAAEQLGRRCYAIEIEPQYCQVTIDRWEAFTGQKAVKAGAA